MNRRQRERPGRLRLARRPAGRAVQERLGGPLVAPEVKSGRKSSEGFGVPYNAITAALAVPVACR